MFTSSKINQRLNSKHMRERFIESNEHTVNTLRKCQHFAKRAVQTLAAVFQPMVRTSCPNLDCFWLFTSTDRQTNKPSPFRQTPSHRKGEHSAHFLQRGVQTDAVNPYKPKLNESLHAVASRLSGTQSI